MQDKYLHEQLFYGFGSLISVMIDLILLRNICQKKTFSVCSFSFVIFSDSHFKALHVEKTFGAKRKKKP